MNSAFQPQIILLREGTDTSQGKSQIISNINACQAVAETVRTTLGPRGMDKLVYDGQRVTISNDGCAASFIKPSSTFSSFYYYRPHITSHHSTSHHSSSHHAYSLSQLRSSITTTLLLTSTHDTIFHTNPTLSSTPHHSPLHTTPHEIDSAQQSHDYEIIRHSTPRSQDAG